MRKRERNRQKGARGEKWTDRKRQREKQRDREKDKERGERKRDKQKTDFVFKQKA